MKTFSSWFIFILFACFAVYMYTLESYTSFFVLSCIAITAIPEGSLKNWLVTKGKQSLVFLKWIAILGAIILLFWLLGKGLNWIFAPSKYDGLTAEEWHDEYAEEFYRAQRYKEALEEANSNIEDGNYDIREVQDSSTINDLIDAADDLDEIDTVDEPY